MSSDVDQPDPGLMVPELLDDEPVRRPQRARRPPRQRRGTRETEAADVVRRRRRLGWWWPALALALVAGSLAWNADHRGRARETAAVQRCERVLGHASVLSEIRMGSMANYVRPAVDQAAGGSGQLHLADLMAPPALEVLPQVQRANRVCRAVSVRSWHFSLVARRNAATAYAGALVTLLQAVASQGPSHFRYDETLVRLRRAAGVE
jgi:hypothetical protein